MKGGSSGLGKLLLSSLIILVVYYFYFRIIDTSIMGYDIAKFLEYVLVSILIFLIYRKDMKKISGYGKGIINTIIYSASCFLCLVIITVVLNKSFNIPLNLTNYLNVNYSLGSILTIIEECFLVPFLLCAIFVLGFSKIFKKTLIACIASAVCYGVLVGVTSTFSIGLVLPVIMMMLFSLLYRTCRNIWPVMITYSMYLLFGVFAINYII